MVRRAATRSVTKKRKTTKSKKAKDIHEGTKRVRRREVNAPKSW